MSGYPITQDSLKRLASNNIMYLTKSLLALSTDCSGDDFSQAACDSEIV